MYSCVVVGTDGSATAATAVHHALRLAAACGAAAHLVTAWSRVPSPALASAALVPGALPVVEDAGWVEPLHDRFADEAGRLGLALERHVLEGMPATVLIEVARRVRADVIVTGNHGVRGIRGVLGSVPRSLVSHAPCPVLVVPTSGPALPV